MTRAAMLLVFSGIFFGLGAFCANLTLESSTFIPDPGASVTLFVRGASSGASFRWDLDGDGTYELTTQEPQVTFTLPQGMRVVRVEVGGEDPKHPTFRGFSGRCPLGSHSSYCP
jgi:hypothetical protein